ncbi:MAG: lysozyme [Terracidiphilus sp.]
MEISAAGMELIKQSEGFRSHVYLDPSGFPTIGYGHRLVHPESFPNGISKAQATLLLDDDVRVAEHEVEYLVRVPLTQGQFDALVDFCFNLGYGRLADSTLLQDLNEKKYDEALDQLLRWDHVDGQVNPGLKARREAEAAMWRQQPTAQQPVA